SLRQALAVATEAQLGASAIGHIPLQIAAMHFLGQTCYYMGRFREGEATLSAAAELTRVVAGQPGDIAVGDPPVLVLAMRGLTRAFLGRFPDAERDVEQAMAIAAARDSAYDVCFAHLASGAVRLHKRDLEAAEDQFRIGLDTARRHQL